MTDFRKLFNSEEFFNENGYIHTSPYQMVEYINEKLNALIELWPVVYGSLDHDPAEYGWSTNNIKSDTHKARLAFIEEIVKKTCIHKAWFVDRKHGDTIFICMDCGKELIPTGFKVKE